MPENGRETIVHHLQALFARAGSNGITDGDLLQHYLADRDEAAFELLLRRHAPLVWRVCWGLLHQRQDAEDAFQATFLILARKARSIRRCASVSGWLFQVARRVALRSRAQSAKHGRSQPLPDDLPANHSSNDLAAEASRRELQPLLQAEIARLPAKYRVPLLLCYFDGQAHAEAARVLGWPLGTLAGRLARAREMLRTRLVRRGVTLSVMALLAAPGQSALSSVVLKATLLAALRFAPGSASLAAIELAQGVLRTMLLTKIKLAVFLVTVGLVVSGAAVFRPRTVDAADQNAAPAPAQENPEGRPALARMASPRDGIILVIGSEIPQAEKVPQQQVITIKTPTGTRAFRKLEIGDKVVPGQLLAVIDDRVARDELAIAKKKVEQVRAEVSASKASYDEANQRYEIVKRLNGLNGGFGNAEQLRNAQFSRAKYLGEFTARQKALEVAELEAKRAQLVLEMYEIRSQVAGTVRAIYKYPGEAVKALEPVVAIQVESERR